MSINSTIYKCFIAYKCRFIILLIANLICMFIVIINTRFSGQYIDSLKKDIIYDEFIYYILLLTFFSVVIIILEIFNSFFLTKLQTEIVFKINTSLLEHIKMLPLEYYKDKDPFYLNQRINSDSNMIVSFFTTAYIRLITSGISLIILFYLLFTLNYCSAIFIIFCMLLFLVAYNTFKQLLYKKTLVFKETQNRFFSLMGKQLNNIAYIKLNVLYKELNVFLMRAFPSFFEKAIDFLKSNILFSSTGAIINSIFSIFLYVFMGNSVIKGKISIGEFLIIQGYYNLVMTKISDLANTLKQYPDAKVSYNRLLEILTTKKEKNGTIVFDDPITSIKVENLHIQFENHVIFENISFILEQGHIYLFDGENGSGKSTLMKCILGLYLEIMKGNVFYNNINIQDLNLYNTRKYKIAVVDQETIFFFDSIEENFNVCVNETDYTKYLNYIDKFEIHLPEESNNANMQSYLSGGEKQKISIINALLKNSEVLFLDEPTSALDKKSVNILKSELLRLKKNRIIVLISHDNRLRELADYEIKLSD